MPYPTFDRSRLVVKPLSARTSDVGVDEILPGDSPSAFAHPSLPILAERIVKAKASQAAAIFIMGAHVVKCGVQRHVIDLMEHGLITVIAMNGAGPIHDWELAMTGRTSESVSRYIKTGEFGLWLETALLNDVITGGARSKLGLGECIGYAILANELPHRDISILAQAYRLGIPVTVHVGIGYDIIHEHANCDGAALGATSYKDFLTFAQAVRGLEGGVLLNFGSAVMGPEVFLKALAMARNVANLSAKEIKRFTVGVFDLMDEPKGNGAEYYCRPWKTLLTRAVEDGGESHYIQGNHRDAIPALRKAIVDYEKSRV